MRKNCLDKFQNHLEHGQNDICVQVKEKGSNQADRIIIHDNEEQVSTIIWLC